MDNIIEIVCGASKKLLLCVIMYIDEFGINYYSKDKVKIIKDKLQTIKPKEYEILLNWLEDAKNYNGIYILGI